jgi:hypothetical protein
VDTGAAAVAIGRVAARAVAVTAVAATSRSQRRAGAASAFDEVVVAQAPHQPSM